MEQLKIKNKEVPKKDYIYYLGSIIHMENDRAEDIYSKIIVGWLKWGKCFKSLM